MSTLGVGLGQCILSVLLFGSMFVPLKKFDTGDGFFAQWLMNIAIMLSGFGVFATENFTQFFPVAMIGGAVWSLGNMMALPVIQRLGLALGMLIWNSTNCLTGWAVSHFGLFGVKARPAPNLFLNYFGLILISIGGIAMALLSGMCYGLNLSPVIYIQDNPEIFPGAPQEALPYVFSHYFGAFLMSTFAFLVYTILKKNEPNTNNKLILPGFASGIIWAVAQTLLFLATANLSASISYPLAATVPGCVSAIWSVFYFKEIQGKRNLTILSIAMGITLVGAAMIGMSKA